MVTLFPLNNSAKIFTASESLLGIIFIGLFLNSLAYKITSLEEKKKNKLIQKHLLVQYHDFRESISRICFRALEIDNEENIQDIKSFKLFFNKEDKRNWYDLLNSLEDDKTLLDDLYIEIDIFIQQVNYALNNIYIKNDSSLRILTRLSQYTYRLKNSDMYSHNQVKYIGGFIFSTMTGWSEIEGYLDSDIILDSIDTLV